MRLIVTVSNLSKDNLDTLSHFGRIVYVSKRARSVILDAKEPVISELKALSFVTQVVPDGIMHMHGDTGEPIISNTEAATKMGLKKPYTVPDDIKIAILDTGIADIPEVNVVQRVELIDDRTADLTHGTWIAGTIGGEWKTIDKYTVGGVIPGVKLIDVPVINSKEYTTFTTLMMALDAAADAGATAINMSLGTPDPCIEAFNNLSKSLYEEGIILVAAGGNFGNSDYIGCPGSSPYTIAVGSVYIDGNYFVPSTFTSIGVDISAVGGNVGVNKQYIASYAPDGLEGMAGTSMAAPYVTAISAVIKSMDRPLNTAQIRSILASSAFKPKDVPDPLLGYGIVNLSLSSFPQNPAPLPPSKFYPTGTAENSILPIAIGVILWAIIRSRNAYRA